LGFFGSDSIDIRTTISLSGIFIISNFLCDILKYQIFLRIYFRASSNLHQKMFESVIRSPIRFFQENPSGRLINHFSNDTGIIETMTLTVFLDFFEWLLMFLGYAITIFIINPWSMIPFLVLSLLYIIITKFSLEPISQAKRLEFFYKGPVFSFISSTLSSTMIIQTYRQEKAFKEKFKFHLDRNIRCNYAFWNISRSYGMAVEFFTLIASILVIITSILLFSSSNQLMAQSLLYMISINEMANYGLRSFIYCISFFISLERNLGYTTLQQEDLLVKSSDDSLNHPHLNDIRAKPPSSEKISNGGTIISDTTQNWPNQGY
jgi:ATP-binding cassette, subfamily C (CFTR/MRP), member 4